MNNSGAAKIRTLEYVRAFAIILVVAFHANYTGVFNAGFIGVDIFFCLSGFLITQILLQSDFGFSWNSFCRFYSRRLRRLYPALLVYISFIVFLGPIYFSNSQDKIYSDALPAAFYFSNWYQILVDQDYFGAFNELSAFTHLWTLAVEWQFYLIWPIVILVIKSLFQAATTRALALFGLSVGSAALMWFFSSGGGSINRVYLGSDTHSFGLILGSVSAVLLSAGSIRTFVCDSRFLNLRQTIAVIIVIFLGYLAFLFNEFDRSLYPWGLYAVSIAGSALVILLASPNGVSQVQKSAKFGFDDILFWVGTRSYSIYLWHWIFCQIFLFDSDQPWTHLIWMLLLTGIFSELSFRFVERPIHEKKWKKGGLSIGVSLVCFFTIYHVIPLQDSKKEFSTADMSVDHTKEVPEISIAQKPHPELLVPVPENHDEQKSVEAKRSYIPKAIDRESKGINVLSEVTDEVVGEEPIKLTYVQARHVSKLKLRLPRRCEDLELKPWRLIPSSRDRVCETLMPDAGIPEDARILVIGDSVVLGLKDRLLGFSKGWWKIDAAVGRQASDGRELLRVELESEGRPDVVVIHLGTNGYINKRQFRDLLAMIPQEIPIILVNNAGPRRWMLPNNKLISNVIRESGDLFVLDWDYVSSELPAAFGPDKIHPSIVGMDAFIIKLDEMVSATLKKRNVPL